jgi:large subunit ribosomal protein L21
VFFGFRLMTGLSMFAVIHTGGKQLRVAHNDRIVVEKLDGEPGAAVSFDRVLMLAGDGEPLIGGAVPAAARVFGEIVAQQKADKVLIFKKKRRKNHRRLRGHRQLQTVVRVTGISLSGEQPAAAAPAEPVTAPVSAPAGTDDAAPTT